MKRFFSLAFLVLVGVLISVPDVSAQRFRGGGGHMGGFRGGSVGNFGGFRGAAPVYRPVNRAIRPVAPIARPYGAYRGGQVVRPGYAYGRGYYPGRYAYGRQYPYRYYNRYGYNNRYYYPYGYYDNSYLWGPAIGLGALAAGTYIGSTYGSSYGSGSYSSVSYGRYCATSARTCLLKSAAPLDTGCSCRVGKGRARGQVVN